MQTNITPFPSIYHLRKIAKIAVLLAASYLFCLIFDPYFFDFDSYAHPLKQLYSLLLALCFLIFCTQLKYIGVCIYSLSCLLFGSLFYAKKCFGYNLSFDLINAIFETNRQEISGFINLQSLAWLAGYSLASVAIFLITRYCLKTKPGTKHQNRKRFLLAIVALAVGYGIFEAPRIIIPRKPSLFFKLADPEIRKNHEMFITGHYDYFLYKWGNPYNLYETLFYGIKYYFHEVKLTDSASYPSLRTKDKTPLTIILVIGESVRADHIGLNGYHRNTTPQLAKQAHLHSLSQMYSYGASTYISLEGILAGLMKQGERADKTSFVSILKKHGFHTSFYAENTDDFTNSRLYYELVGKSMDKRATLRMPIARVADTIVHDIQQNTNPNKFILVENGTGHYPYITESKYSTFQPCKIDWLSVDDIANREEKLPNDYDNCILALDDFLSRLIEGIKDSNAVLLYCSDHGQSLGEGGQFMHGDNKNVIMRHVASFIWFSDTYIQQNPELARQIAAVKDKPLIHGQIYATMLRLSGIESEVPLSIGDFIQDNALDHETNLPAQTIEQLRATSGHAKN